MTRTRIEALALQFLREHRVGNRTTESLALDLADLVEKIVADSKGPCIHDIEAEDRRRNDNGYF